MGTPLGSSLASPSSSSLLFGGCAFLHLLGPHSLPTGTVRLHTPQPAQQKQRCLQRAESLPSKYQSSLDAACDLCPCSLRRGWFCLLQPLLKPPGSPHRGEGHVDDVKSTLQPWGDDGPSTPRRAHGSHQEHVLDSKDQTGWVGLGETDRRRGRGGAKK